MKKVKSPQLYLLVRDEILGHIHDNQIMPGALLPSESELTRKLGISRGTLREAMRVLEEEGVVRRMQGLGTFVCDTNNVIRSTLDLNESVSEMIIGKKMKPGSKESKIEKTKASQKIAGKLNLNRDDPIIALTRVRTANDVPIAYTIDYVPANLVPKTLPEDFPGGSIYTYLEERLGIGLTNSMVHIQPIRAPKEIAKTLDIKPGDLLMLLKQTDRNANFEPVLYSEEYFVADRFEFTVYRRRRKII